MQYDHNGIRTKKSRTGGINNVDQYYYWQGDKLLAEQHDSQFIWYYYDETGVSGMRYNNTDYYFRKNIMGDVIAIYDSNGNWQGRYDYDAWGNFKIEGNSSGVLSWKIRLGIADIILTKKQVFIIFNPAIMTHQSADS